jgi:hyperosmotically inducible protein
MDRSSDRGTLCAFDIRMDKNLIAFWLGACGAAFTLVACDRSSNDDAPVAAQAPQVQQAEERMPARDTAQAAATAAPAASSPIPARDALADTVITGKIKTAILNDAAMHGADVSVNTDRGVVTLAGLVKTPEQTAIASAHAQRQDGVMRVDNHLAPMQQ